MASSPDLSPPRFPTTHCLPLVTLQTPPALGPAHTHRCISFSLTLRAQAKHKYFQQKTSVYRAKSWALPPEFKPCLHPSLGVAGGKIFSDQVTVFPQWGK